MVDNKDFAKVMKDAINKAFGLKTEVDMESKLKQETENAENSKENTIDVKNAWVWVEGYKGTDRDMKCQGFQYELGTTYRMPREKVSECSTGFHLCLNMDDVQQYYPIGGGNRYFKVRALVRLSDKNEYGRYPEYDSNNPYSYLIHRHPRNKLVAAEIEFLEELTVDEILADHGADKWPEKYKKMAIESGVNKARNFMQIETLETYGFSLPFAQYLVDHEKYEVAKAVGSQADLSMDMKVLMIMQG